MIQNKIHNYYVYIYLDPRKKGSFIYGELQKLGIINSFYFQPFYIGKGVGNRIKRGLEIKGIKNNTFKKNTIKNICSEKLFPISIKLIENLTSDEACFYEKILIKEIGRVNIGTGILTNLTEGGEGVVGNTLSNESKAKLSKSLKKFYLNNPDSIENIRKRAMGNKNMLCKRHTKETKNIISRKILGRKESVITKEKKSIAFKGRIYSKEHNNKISQALTGKKLSQEHINSLSLSHMGHIPSNAKKVKNIELNQIFNSATAASKFFKVDRHRILSCCEGLIKVCGGFHWKYLTGDIA